MEVMMASVRPDCEVIVKQFHTDVWLEIKMSRVIKVMIKRLTWFKLLSIAMNIVWCNETMVDLASTKCLVPPQNNLTTFLPTDLFV